MKKKMINRLGIILLILLIIQSLSALSVNLPEGAKNLTIVDSTRRPSTASDTLSAIAGNVSQLNIYAWTTTKTWQGYYGNVTGKIQLGDSSGYTLYDWQTSNPSGQIYASTSEVDFSDGNIECYNFTRTGGLYLDISAYESSLDIPATASDGINETFNLTADYDDFYIGTTRINQTCPTAYLYNSSNQSSKDTYQELILYDLTANIPIYTSIIQPDGIVGFDGNIWNFQMIVAENGRLGDDTPTDYFFYVQLE
ncbi:hypothetical protein GOV09_03580 [Candidatus Woesearchaeota archaeon]|nr:hypothetical protein [Candidatus Woesearchaeota archaeon]